jgi:hypothetical protein
MAHPSVLARVLPICVVVLLGAVIVTGCRDDGSGEATMCYPVLPSVTPAAAPAGATVTVTSTGIGNCPYRHRLRSYEVRLQTTPLGVNRRGPHLGDAVLDPTTGTFTTTAVLPAGTAPGSYYVAWGRAPTDHYDWPTSCDDTNASCPGPLPPNLIVTPWPATP